MRGNIGSEKRQKEDPMHATQNQIDSVRRQLSKHPRPGKVLERAAKRLGVSAVRFRNGISSRFPSQEYVQAVLDCLGEV
jgi:hypothetical protein